MSSPADRQVAALVHDETAALKDFISVLEREQVALVDGRLDELLGLAKTKGELAGKLSALDDQRLRAVGAGPGTDHSQQMARWLASRAEPELASDWSALLAIAATARHLNTTNGKLIAERMRHNQQALAVLLSAGDAASLYGPDGQQRLGSSGRPLGSA